MLQFLIQLTHLNKQQVMNTLTIPQLNLFHTRRHSPKKIKDFSSNKLDQTYQLKNDYLTRNIHHYHREELDLINVPVRDSSSRYKRIADDYLQKRAPLPSYYPDPMPYVYNIPSYMYQPSPKRCRKLPCECETHIPQRDNIQHKNVGNPYIVGGGVREKSYQLKQPRILKQPYLQPTFREGRGFIEHHRAISNQTGLTLVKNLSNKNGSTMLKHDQFVNSKIMEKLKTHQSDQQEQAPKFKFSKHLAIQKHETSIQTEKIANNSSTSPNREKHRSSSSSRVEKILQQQRMLIESLKLEFEKQNEFKFDVQDLQSTKNQYIDRSRELLLKLNELADDRRQFAFVFKAVNDKRKHNVFSGLEL